MTKEAVTHIDGTLKIISPETEKSCFFGYYDLKGYDDTDSFHLCNMADFEDRIPTPSDALTLGVVDISERRFEKIAETYAWNFQQGAMLQWHRKKKDTVFYNAYKNGEYMTVEKNLKTGHEHFTPVCANISRCGKWGLSVNFLRIYDFRAGYGYCNEKDPYFDIPQPANDGVFLVNMETGDKKLICTYPEMASLIGLTSDRKLVVNHITFNPSATKFMMLVRTFPSENDKTWATNLIISDLSGNMKLFSKMTMYSHYDWEDDDILFGYCTHNGVDDCYWLNTETGIWREIPDDMTKGFDIHCLYSPDKNYILGDGCPNGQGYRNVYLYDCRKEKYRIVLTAHCPHSIDTVEFRSDFHNRWNTKGTSFSYDTIQNGRRQILEVDLSETGLIY